MAHLYNLRATPVYRQRRVRLEKTRTKLGGIGVRKLIGYSHIQQRFATRINAFYTEHLNPYLNLHRPCLFATERVDAKGRVRKIYFAQDMQTPLEKLSRLTRKPFDPRSGSNLNWR